MAGTHNSRKRVWITLADGKDDAVGDNVIDLLKNNPVLAQDKEFIRSIHVNANSRKIVHAWISDANGKELDKLWEPDAIIWGPYNEFRKIAQ